MKTETNDNQRVTINLNGTWGIQPGGKDERPSVFTHHIEVPSLVDCASPPYDWSGAGYHWYRKSFVVPESMIGRTAFLKIEQSMYGTAVWVNGDFAGESISCYTSQEYRTGNRLKYGKINEILVRVGQRSTLPPESAVGKDQERISFIPGIWGDVKLLATGAVRVKLVQTLPHIADSSLDIKVWVENLVDIPLEFVVTAQVKGKSGGELCSEKIGDTFSLPANSQTEIHFRLEVRGAKLWSPESPFLYLLEVDVTGSEGAIIDRKRVVFGMREFSIRGKDFFLNGEKIYLRGSNIAFHRFLSDADRRLLPWNEDWVRKILVDIPKEHNFNFFRAHLGHMYNRWYDIADQGGIMLQDEWQFWGTTGTKEQITNEFTQWLKDNWNHPSIVIWDPLNESSDEIVQKEIIPEMKKLDPTRPWESHDFFEDHPYIHSLGPVLVDRRFGFTRSLTEIESSPYPSQVNEYLWWWLDKNLKPSELTKKVASRWLGDDCTEDELVAHQSFLAAELTELFRRLDVKCIQPFVYLSSNEGPTSHWFVGNIAEANPKAALSTLGNAFEPLGVSIELWDRHFFQGESRAARVHVFNDYPFESEGRMRVGITDSSREWIDSENLHVHLDGSARGVRTVNLKFPENPGDYYVVAELNDSRTGRRSVSEKIAQVYPSRPYMGRHSFCDISVFEPTGEIAEFLRACGCHIVDAESTMSASAGVLLVVGNPAEYPGFAADRERIDNWVQHGGRLILVQPEYGVLQRVSYQLPGALKLSIAPRVDRDEGGYDSYVIASDHSRRLWKRIRKEDLRMFNGAYGGEMVPEFDLVMEGDHEVLARSGLGLARPVVIASRVGNGSVLVSSMEIMGRLIPAEGCYESLYAARPDPVARQSLLNLIGSSSQERTKGHRRPDRFPVR